VSCIDARGVKRSVDIAIVKQGQHNEQKAMDKKVIRKKEEKREAKKRETRCKKKEACLLV
jgi:hypothetical protein